MNSEFKKGDPSKVAKPKKVSNKVDKPKKQKGKPNKKVIKDAVKDELVQAPAPVTPKVIDSPVKKVIPSSKSNKQKKPPQNGNNAETLAVDNAAPVIKSKPKKNKKRDTQLNFPGEKVSPKQTLFVGNLPVNTKRVQIVKHFSSFGPMLSIRLRTSNGKIIFKHKTRKASGFLNAYVSFKDEETATKALELNGSDFKGNHLRVTRSDQTNENADPKRIIFVGNLTFSATDDKLHQIFSSCGEIEYVRTLQDKEKSGCKGVAYVCFKSPDAVGLALELKGTVLDERPIHVERYSVNKLGAKERRDAEAERTNAANKQKGTGKKPANKAGGPQNKNVNESVGDEKKKKSEYRGVKSELNKKKPKKKLPTEMKKLAKKIAPKADAE